jgi:hypothetical protein
LRYSRAPDATWRGKQPVAALIDITGLTKRFGSFTAVSDVTFSAS